MLKKTHIKITSLLLLLSLTALWAINFGRLHTHITAEGKYVTHSHLNGNLDSTDEEDGNIPINLHTKAELMLYYMLSVMIVLISSYIFLKKYSPFYIKKLKTSEVLILLNLQFPYFNLRGSPLK